MADIEISCIMIATKRNLRVGVDWKSTRKMPQNMLHGGISFQTTHRIGNVAMGSIVDMNLSDEDPIVASEFAYTCPECGMVCAYPRQEKCQNCNAELDWRNLGCINCERYSWGCVDMNCMSSNFSMWVQKPIGAIIKRRF